jgi:hypothetical protein
MAYYTKNGALRGAALLDQYLDARSLPLIEEPLKALSFLAIKLP